ncbi:tetratricopeptide repeat protein [Zeaxanthinibacter sp. PT1]|uniref:tetratricopeptide repeat protein n=1 Tax=Zeaxanthinibacter TaxID=561554 RepID=UPI002348F46D|nr:tetratricopeptide repeat protein [Zeaxanthinibacter sp. PT1]MDC6352253.1 tetratricopeptide repeat protein [Zeaxanthinibacter sp. PT1]
MRTLTVSRFVLVLLCLFIGFLGTAQLVDPERNPVYRRVFHDTDNFGPSYLEILETSLPLVTVDSTRNIILYDLAYYWHSRNLKKSLHFAEQGINSSIAQKDWAWKARFQGVAGAVLLRMEALDEAMIMLREAAKILPLSEKPFLYTQMGYVYERKGKLDLATDYALKSLELGIQLQDDHAMAIAYSDLSNIFWKQQKYEQALRYGLESIRIFELRGLQDLDYDFTLYVVGNCYLALGDREQAEKYYEHAIAIGERYGFYNNLSDVYISMVDLHSFTNNYQKAERFGLKALEFANLLDNNFMVMRCYLAIGKMQNLQGKFISAIENLEKCIEVATIDFHDSYYLAQAYEALGRSYAGNHQYREAYSAMEMYDQFKNEVFTAEADNRTSVLQTEYKLAEKETTIQEQEGRLRRQQARQTLIIIVALLMFLLLLLLYKAVKNNSRKNRLLLQQNREKEFLLKEIHHRVKNNLEIISSLLSLQSAKIDDPKIAEAMDKSQQRVHSMSMIHQKLYKGKSLSSIEMKDYFENLGEHIVNTHGAQDRVEVRCEMNPLELHIDLAIPIGLIVNELLTNSLKYAFPGKRPGIIVVALSKADDIVYLELSDNGIGKSAEARNEGTGFGTQLIELLTRQLDGKMQLNQRPGTSFTFEFNPPKAA